MSMTAQRGSIVYERGIVCIDTELFRPGLACCYLIVDDGEAAFVDTGTRNSVPLLMQVLADQGLQPGQVRWVMPTHVHLDHAGGAGALMQLLPNARMLVHERGAAHMIDPAKLQAGSLAVYGEQRYQAAFGSLVPVPAHRVQTVHDGDRFALGRRELHIVDTPGHARHHYVVYDSASAGLFCGDSFGVSYPELNTGRQRFIFPPSTPVQFDPSAWHQTIERLLAMQPEAVYLTHFGRHGHVSELATMLHEEIDAYVMMAESHQRDQPLSETLMQHSLKHLSDRQCPQSPAVIRQLLAGDMDLNAQGLLHWLQRSAH